jgi:hypothetical protein
MPHPDEGLIHAWLDRELDPAEAARVEALVASDPEWAVAALEARGLLAASTRIVGTLDRVPANVMPQPASPRRATRRWVWRAAAVVALMAGSAVVLERGTPELTAPEPAKSPAVARSASDAAGAAPAPGAVVAPSKKAKPAVTPRQTDASKDTVRRVKTGPGFAVNAPPADVKSTVSQKELYNARQVDSVRTTAAGSALAGERADAAVASRRVPPAPAASPAAAGGAPMQAQALAKTTRLRPSCFLRRNPADSAWRIIRLNALALADSIRLERLTLRGDSLAAMDGSLIAIRVPCPAP